MCIQKYLFFHVLRFALDNLSATSTGPCVKLPFQWKGLLSVHLEDCSGINDGFLLQLLSNAAELRSISVISCENVTAGGFASMACTRLCQLELVRCANVKPDIVMAASALLIGESLAAFNMSKCCLGALKLNSLHHITVLVIDNCFDVSVDSAIAVVSGCRFIKLLSAACVSSFSCPDVLQQLHELPLVHARLSCSNDFDAWAFMASFVLCARTLLSLVIFKFDDADSDSDGEGQSSMQRNVSGGMGAKDCKNMVAGCLNMRGGSLRMAAWIDERDSWRL